MPSLIYISSVVFQKIVQVWQGMKLSTTYSKFWNANSKELVGSILADFAIQNQRILWNVQELTSLTTPTCVKTHSFRTLLLCELLIMRLAPNWSRTRKQNSRTLNKSNEHTTYEVIPVAGFMYVHRWQTLDTNMLVFA